MTNEKHINNWKDRLNELSSLPGENSRSMEKSWEKLDARLNAKKEKKRAYLYWVAAASVLLFVTVSILQDNQKETPVREIANSNETPGKAGLKQSTIAESIPAIVTAPLPAKEKTLPSVSNRLHTKHPLHTTKDSSVSVQLISIQTDSADDIAATPKTIKERPVIFTSLKKKLPIVHLNELEKPVPAVEAVAGNSDHPGLKIRFFNRDISPVSNDAGNNIITIKLPPQN